jgi:hypothetical protein
MTYVWYADDGNMPCLTSRKAPVSRQQKIQCHLVPVLLEDPATGMAKFSSSQQTQKAGTEVLFIRLFNPQTTMITTKYVVNVPAHCRSMIRSLVSDGPEHVFCYNQWC